MRQVVLCITACNFNDAILNQSIFNCLVTSASTLQQTLYVLVYSLFFLQKKKKKPEQS